MDAVDVAMGRIGVVEHDKKDVTGVLVGTVIGIYVRETIHLHPNVSKLRTLLLEILLVVHDLRGEVKLSDVCGRMDGEDTAFIQVIDFPVKPQGAWISRVPEEGYGAIIW